MEYNGFISTLIERSEQLLGSDTTDELNVTRLLLILSAGFTLVRDRIDTWDNADDSRLRSASLKKEIKKARESSFATPISHHGRRFFEDFRTCRDWVYLQVPKEQVPSSPSAHNLEKYLSAGEIRPIEDLTLDHAMRALRNSFAHGGVLPMSPEQGGPRINSMRPLGLGCRQIDRVYFISKWTQTVQHSCGHDANEQLGWIVMEFGMRALAAFWNGWKEFILASSPSGLDQLDWVA